MTTLATYLSRAGSKKLTDIATAVGISKGRLSQLRDKTDWPPQLALDVEAATNGGVDASELSAIVASARQGRAA